MLLFLLSLYLHYGLLNGEEINSAKFNESLLVDKHHQNLLRMKSLMRDLEQRFKEAKSVIIVDNYENDTLRGEEFVSHANIKDLLKSSTVRQYQKHQITKDPTKSPAEFLHSSQNDPYDPHLDISPLFPGSQEPPSVVVQSPSPDSIALVTLKRAPDLKSGLLYPGYLLSPRHSMYPGVMMPQRLLSVNGPARYIGSFSYSPSPTRPTSERLQVLHKEPPIKDHFDRKPHRLKAFNPSVSPSISISARSSKTPPRLTTPSRKMDVNAKIWLEEIAPYTPVHKRLKKVSKDYPASSKRRGRSTVPTPPRMAQARNHRWSTGTANTAHLFIENEHGFLYVTPPKTMPEDPNRDSTTTAGDVLYGKIKVPKPSTPSPKQRYFDLMEQLDEGYLMLFVIEMCRLIAVKDTRQVREALHHMEIIYNNNWSKGQLSWIDEPLQTVITKLLRAPPGRDDAIEIIQLRSSMMFHMLLDRKQVLSPEVNTIIDHAEVFYNDEDGERLLDSLKEFEDYPDTTKTSYSICDALIESFLLPFRRASGSERRQRVLDSINKALKDRFPLFLRRPHRGRLTAGGSAKSEDLDYSTADFWWSGTPKFNATELMTPPYPFLPTPHGHGWHPGRPPERDTRYPAPPKRTTTTVETLPPFPNITRPSYPFPIEAYTLSNPSNKIFKHPEMFTGHIQYPGLTPPPNFPSDYKYPTVLPPSDSPTTYIPTPTGPTPKGPSFTLPNVERPSSTFPTLTPGPPTTSPTIPDWVLTSTSRRPQLSFVSWDPVDPYVQMWKNKIASDSAVGGTPSDVVPALRPIVNYD